MSRSPIRMHGGKSYFADWIISLMPPHTHYVEPFFGGGSILFSKPIELIEGHSEVVNDLDKGLYNFFRVMQDDELRSEFLRILQFLPFSEDEFKRAKADLPHHYMEWSNLPAAIDYFIVNRQSRQGLGKDFATLSRTRTRRGMNEQASSWLTAVNELDSFCERLKRVVILNRPAIDVIAQQDGKDTLIVADPPYLQETRVAGEYGHEMTDQDHQELLDTLAAGDSKFLLCGYHSEMYDKWAIDNKIEVFEREVTAHSSSADQKPTRKEVVWRRS